MSDPQAENCPWNKISPRWLPAIDRLLVAGIRLGPRAKHEAINKVLQLVPEWTRGDCWRRIRKLRKQSDVGVAPVAFIAKRQEPARPRQPKQRRSARPWNASDDDRLLNLAGYEPVSRIAQRLDRSVGAVRFRLGALGMSARVTDGWTQRALRKLLHMSAVRIRCLVGTGRLRVRDARISAQSLVAFRANNSSVRGSARESTDDGDLAYTWGRVADLLRISAEEVQKLVCNGRLKVLDPFVTDRSFEEFCHKHGDELNLSLIDPGTRKWLVKEYGVAEFKDERSVARAQKHALTIRTCPCGRVIAGNVYFRHVRHCQVAVQQSMLRAG